MYTNYPTNGCCYNDFYNLNYTYNSPACDGYCYCSTSCFYQTCQQSTEIFPTSYKKLSNMPPKPKEILSNKNSSKSKKLSKTKENQSKNSNAEIIVIESGRLSNICSSMDISRICPRLSQSESDLGRKFKECERTTSSSFSNTDSCCQYQCSCKKLAPCAGKHDLDLKLLTHYDNPIKQIHDGQGERYSVKKSSNCKETSNYNCQQQGNLYKALENSKGVSSDTKTSQDMQNPSFMANCIIQPINCYCMCCKNDLATKTSHTFNPSKSCAEQPQNEEARSHSSSVESRPKHEAASSQPKTKTSLEETCANFLNIVCGNISESVQDSVACKLKEFSSRATKNFECLDRKLENNEAKMRSLYCELMKKMAEQNKKHFEKLYSLVQDVVKIEKQTARKDHQSKECQCELPMEKKEINKNDIKILRCGCCNCCSANTMENTYGYSGSLKKTKNETQKDHLDMRKSGGCIKNEENKNALREETKIWGLPVKCCNTTSPQNLISREVKAQYDTSLFLASCTAPRAASPNTFTTFSLTPSGRTIFNCNCSADTLDVGTAKTNARVSHAPNIKTKKNLDLKLVCRSGCAREPEDNNEAAVCTGDRKKLQKKASKHCCNAETSGPVISGW